MALAAGARLGSYEINAHGPAVVAGETISDTLAAVLKEQPDLTRAPARVRRLLHACLQKDPKQRLQAIGDARLLLEDAPEAMAEAKSRMPWAIAAAFAIMTALALWAPWRRPVPDIAQTARRLAGNLRPWCWWRPKGPRRPAFKAMSRW